VDVRRERAVRHGDQVSELVTGRGTRGGESCIHLTHVCSLLTDARRLHGDTLQTTTRGLRHVGKLGCVYTVYVCIFLAGPLGVTLKSVNHESGTGVSDAGHRR
jgi:hypothetical protein